MKTNIYLIRTNAYNAVVFDQHNGHYFMNEGDRNGHIDGIVDLYSENVAAELKEYFTTNDPDITGMCNGNCVMSGDFDPNEPGVESKLIMSYDDVDTSELVNNLL